MSLTHSSPIAYLYFVLDIIIIVLNSAEVYMIWREKIGKTFSKLFLVNLSSSDLFVGICLTISDVMYFLMSRTLIELSRAGATVIFFIAESIVLFACLSSLCNLCTLTIDRLIGVCKPVEYRNIMTRRRAFFMIFISWLLSLTATVATTILFQISHINIVLHVMLIGVTAGSLFLLITYAIIFFTVRRQQRMFPRRGKDNRNCSIRSDVTDSGEDKDGSLLSGGPRNYRKCTKESLDPIRAFSKMKRKIKRQDLKLLRISTGILVSFFTCWWPVTIIHCNMTLTKTISFDEGVMITILMQLNSILNSIVYFKWRERRKRKGSAVDKTLRAVNTAATAVSQPLVLDAVATTDQVENYSKDAQNGIANVGYRRRSSGMNYEEGYVEIELKKSLIIPHN